MRLAILVAGRLLHFKEHYANIMEKIVQENTVDFFVSHSPELNDNVEEFKELYKPITFNNELLQIKEINPNYRHPNEVNCKKMFYNRQRVFNDFKEYITNNALLYDIIINYRIDTYSSDRINYCQFTDLHTSTIYIPSGADWSQIGTCDQMAFGNIDVMERYMSIYNDIDHYLGVGGCRITGEELVYTCLKVNNIKTVRFAHEHMLKR